MTIDKVMADHRLLVESTLAKIKLILQVFMSEKVIDVWVDRDEGMFKKIVLEKQGYYTYVNITTNGKVIYLAGQTYAESFDAELKCPIDKFFKVDSTDFDWNVFSDKLLDYIHRIIYARQEVVESMIGNIFNEQQ